MQVLFSEHIVAEYDPDKRIIEMHWKGQVPSEQLRESYQQMLDFAKNNHVKHWLLDMRKMGSPSEKDEAWIDKIFFPHLMMAFGRNNYIGMVLPEENYEKLLKENGDDGLHSYNSFIIINTFGSYTTALEWLTSKNHKE